MEALKKLLGLAKNPFTLRYSKALDEWELIFESDIVYIGSKQGCERYMKTVEATIGK